MTDADKIEIVHHAEDDASSDKQAKIKIVMHEFKAGTLKSASGEPVTDRKQAIAIALSEQRKVDEQHARNRKKAKRK